MAITNRMPRVKATLAQDNQGHPVQVPYLDVANSQAATISTGGSVALTAFDASNDRLVYLVSTVDAWVAIGSSPTAAAATDGNMFLPADQPQYVGVPAGEQVAVIGGAAGTVNAVPAH